jgi:hypothetical protein
MPPRFDDDPVSPELALVDPDLAARARSALPAPGSARRPPEDPPREIAVAARSRSSRHVATTPVLTLLATAAASLIVTAFSGPEQANGESPSAKADSPAGATSAVASTRAGSGTTESAQPVGDDDVLSYGAQQRVDSNVGQAASSSETSSVARTAVAKLRVAVSPTTLVWPRAANASWYDFELVRGGSVIFSIRSRSSHAIVPRSWRRKGVAYAIQPEDQVFVWSVVDGRRASAPVVNGALALDMTLVARFSELSQSRAHP